MLFGPAIFTSTDSRGFTPRSGVPCSTWDTQNARLYRESAGERLAGILRPGGLAVSCGWNSVGFGKAFEMEELMLLVHGGAHNDTIAVTVERKMQAGFDFNAGAKSTALSQEQREANAIADLVGPLFRTRWC